MVEPILNFLPIVDELVDPTTPPSTKVRAAEAILNHGAKAIGIEDIEARVAELERAAEASKQIGRYEHAQASGAFKAL